MSIVISEKPFGRLETVDITEYTLQNDTGMRVSIISYGATVTKIITADKNGLFENIVIGFDDLEKYTDRNNPYVGATVGRYCNRIANGKFMLEGKEYTLAKNNNGNSLHGGIKGFDKVAWKATKDEPNGSMQFEHLSEDGNEGFPGNLKVTVTYTLTNNNELIIYYKASTDKATPVNLTNHCYFNLSGIMSTSILGHELKLYSDTYTVIDERLIPTGEIRSVKNTALDFTSFKKIGMHISEIGGYDHNMVINGYDDSGEPKIAALLYEPGSGRLMEMFTTEPGVQFYSGNLEPGPGEQAGLCLEAQHYPDSPNQPQFPTTILYPGQEYFQRTMYKFGIKISSI